MEGRDHGGLGPGRERQREGERERDKVVYINIYNDLYNAARRLLGRAKLTDAVHTRTHTHRHRRGHRDNVGEVEPLQGTRRPLAEAARTCGKTANGGLAEGLGSLYLTRPLRLRPSLCFLPAANKMRKKKKERKKTC